MALNVEVGLFNIHLVQNINFCYVWLLLDWNDVILPQNRQKTFALYPFLVCGTSNILYASNTLPMWQWYVCQCLNDSTLNQDRSSHVVSSAQTCLYNWPYSNVWQNMAFWRNEFITLIERRWLWGQKMKNVPKRTLYSLSFVKATNKVSSLVSH